MAPPLIDKDYRDNEAVIVPGPGASKSRSLARDLLSGTSALGIAMLIERGFGFVANVMAARFAGSQVFGAYSVSLTTATNIANYAAGGIGSTATRFSAQPARDTAEYAAVVRALSIISLVSAAIAMGVLYGTAGFLAHWLLRKDDLAGLLRLASLCAGGAILLECFRGFLIGRRRLGAIVLLSGIVGAGMLGLMPVAAHYGPTPMVATQAGVAFAAVIACLVFARRLGLSAVGRPARKNVSAMVRQIWGFGLVQLSGLVVLNLAGWWLTSLVARSDKSLAQVGLFAVAHQLRNVVALGPALLTESALALMIGGHETSARDPERVLAVCTFASVAVTVLCAGIGIILLPWALPMAYGAAFRPGVLPAALALATSVVHMGSAPAGARLTIVSIRAWGVINAVWAAVVAIGATVFVTRGGAASATAIYLVAHFVSGTVTFTYLRMRKETSSGTVGIYLLGAAGVALLSGEELLRLNAPGHMILWSGIMAATVAATLWVLTLAGRSQKLVPDVQQLAQFWRSFKQSRLSFASGAGSESGA